MGDAVALGPFRSPSTVNPGGSAIGCFDAEGSSAAAHPIATTNEPTARERRTLDRRRSERGGRERSRSTVVRFRFDGFPFDNDMHAERAEDVAPEVAIGLG